LPTSYALAVFILFFLFSVCLRASVVKNLPAKTRNRGISMKDEIRMTKQTEDEAITGLGIRLAVETDCPAINDIYNYYVSHSTCTYQTEPETIESRRGWFAAHGPGHPVTVAEMDGVIVGWGSLSRFHPRAAYARTVENAVYVHHAYQKRGIGNAIVVDLLGRARALQHHTIIALISAEQTASISLHSKLGFTHAGLIKEAGFKFDQWLDVVYMQKML